MSIKSALNPSLSLSLFLICRKTEASPVSVFVRSFSFSFVNEKLDEEIREMIVIKREILM